MSQSKKSNSRKIKASYELTDLWGANEGPKEEYSEWSEVRKLRPNKRSKYTPSQLPTLETPTHAISYRPDENEHQKLLVSAINEQIHHRKKYAEVDNQIKVPSKKEIEQRTGVKEFTKKEIADLDIASEESEEDSDEDKEHKFHDGHRTNTQLNKEKKKKRNIRLATKQKRRKERRAIPFDSHIQKAEAAIKEENDKKERASEAYARKKEREKTKTLKLGDVGYVGLDLDVVLPEDLPNSLREVNGKINPMLGHLNRYQKRNMLEPRKIQPPRLSKFAPIEYERNPAKVYKNKEMERYLGKST